MRQSITSIQSDVAGEYEVEVFNAEKPKNVIICVHGNGVRRWDGAHFFHKLADHYPSQACYLVDQNQVIEDGCSLNTLEVMTERVQKLITLARNEYPSSPLVIVAHSMGCGIVTRLDLSEIEKVVFVTPGAGDALGKLIERYGDSIKGGGSINTSDGLKKYLSKEHVDSIDQINWEDEYSKLLGRYPEVYAFEAEEEEIVSEERFKHRDMPFRKYKFINGASHNLSGEPLQAFFIELDKLVK